MNNFKTNWKQILLLIAAIVATLYLVKGVKEEAVVKSLQQDVEELKENFEAKNDTIAEFQKRIDELDKKQLKDKQEVIEKQKALEKKLNYQLTKNKEDYERNVQSIDTASVNVNFDLFRTNFSEGLSDQ